MNAFPLASTSMTMSVKPFLSCEKDDGSSFDILFYWLPNELEAQFRTAILDSFCMK